MATPRSEPASGLSRWMFNRGIKHAVEIMRAHAKMEKTLVSIGQAEPIDESTVARCAAWATSATLDEKTWSDLMRVDEPVPVAPTPKEPRP